MYICIHVLVAAYKVSTCTCTCGSIVHSVSPRINERGGGGDLAGTQSMKLYLGAWYMYILHS